MSAPWDGKPENPERDGWHWLLVAFGVGHPFPMMWAADGMMWDAGDAGWTHAEDIATRWRYLGPCLTPAEHAAAVQAERAACAEIAKGRSKAPPEIGDDWRHGPAEAEFIAGRILVRGDTSALAAVVKSAYREGWNDREGDFMAGTARIGIDDAAVEAARREEREACESISRAERMSAEAWLAHADSYGGPESPQRPGMVAKRDVAARIEKTIRARSDGEEVA